MNKRQEHVWAGDGEVRERINHYMTLNTIHDSGANNKHTDNDHRRDVHGVVMIVMPMERRVRTNGASGNSKE